MKHKFLFTFQNLKNDLNLALNEGYKFIRCCDYPEAKNNLAPKTIVYRIDVDQSPPKAKRLLSILNKLGIKATFFIRLHGEFYNPLSIENYKLVRSIVNSGHEVGYHSEIIDEAVIWDEDADECMRRDIEVYNKSYGVSILGVSSHGNRSGLNNLDFWKTRKPSDFGLLYEAYDNHPEFNLFYESVYLSDSPNTFWKKYNNGILIENDKRQLNQHIKEGYALINLLSHPVKYYDEHPYE